MGKSSGHLPAHFEDPQADTRPAQQTLPAEVRPSSCIPGMAPPTTSLFPLLLLCSTWPRTKLVLPGTCHLLSALSCPLKKRKKTKLLPRGLQTGDAGAGCTKLMSSDPCALHTCMRKMPGALKSTNEKSRSTSACTCRRGWAPPGL